ncbi:MAG: hypothetical protein IPM38_14325 [Ignavibacteria bacterium]|nr:hypothetical protein [Ignavibacteria bacterium]
MFEFKNNKLWMIGISAVFIIQSIILFFWEETKFLTFANILILLASVIGYGRWRFYKKFQNDVLKYLDKEVSLPDSILTETDILHLPKPVKKYIRYTGSVGQPKINNFKIIFNGKIRKDDQSEWMPFTSEQYNFPGSSVRLFFMKAVMKKLPVAGYHCFIDGDAFMDIRLLSLFKVQYLEGEEMDMAETVTFFNDICCMAPGVN